MADYVIESVSRAMRALDVLSTAESMTLVDVSQKLGLSKASAYRLLSTLCVDDLVVQNKLSKRYSLGPKLIALGQRALESTNVMDAALEQMELLADRYHVVVTLNLPTKDAVLEARRVPRHGRGDFIPVGAPIPYHACASGLVFLAYGDREHEERVIAAGLARFASGTVDSEEALDAALDKARKLGFARAQDTLEEGITAVAAPVFDQVGIAAATIGATGPHGALDGAAWKNLTKDLVVAANVVSHSIGGKGASARV